MESNKGEITLFSDVPQYGHPLYPILQNDIEFIKSFFDVSEDTIKTFLTQLKDSLTNEHYHWTYILNLLDIFVKIRPKRLSLVKQFFQILIDVYNEEILNIYDTINIKYPFTISKLVEELSPPNINQSLKQLYANSGIRMESIYQKGTLEYILMNDECDELIEYFVQNPNIDMVTVSIKSASKSESSVYFGVSTIYILDFAAFFGSVKCFKYLLVNGCSITERTEKMGVAGGETEIVQIMKQNGSEFKKCLADSISFHRYEISDWLMMHYTYPLLSLEFCLKQFHYESFIYYLIKGAKTNHKNDCGFTLLHQACIHGPLEFVDYLICNTEVPIKSRDNTGESALHFACKCNRNPIPIVDYLINKHHFDVNSTNTYMKTPIYIACENGRLELVKYLIENHHVNLEVKDNNHEYTPLLIACKNNHLPVVRYLIENTNVNKYAKGKGSETIVTISIESGNVEILQYLIEKAGFDKEQRDERTKMTPLHQACRMGQLNIVKYLIEKAGADKNAEYRCNILFLATESRNIELVQYLINNAKFDPKTTNNFGETILHIAVQSGCLEIVKYFVEDLKLDINAKDKRGETPIDCAYLNKNIREYLKNMLK